MHTQIHTPARPESTRCGSGAPRPRSGWSPPPRPRPAPWTGRAPPPTACRPRGRRPRLCRLACWGVRIRGLNISQIVWLSGPDMLFWSINRHLSKHVRTVSLVRQERKQVGPLLVLVQLPPPTPATPTTTPAATDAARAAKQRGRGRPPTAAGADPSGKAPGEQRLLLLRARPLAARGGEALDAEPPEQLVGAGEGPVGDARDDQARLRPAPQGEEGGGMRLTAAAASAAAPAAAGGRAGKGARPVAVLLWMWMGGWKGSERKGANTSN